MRRAACLAALCLLPLPALAGLGLTLREAESAYGANRLPSVKAEDFARLDLSTNLTAVTEHVWTNGTRVAIGYEPWGADGEPRGVVVKYSFAGSSSTPSNLVARLLELNAEGGTWDERSMSPGAREKREFLRSDSEARLRAFMDAPEAVALSRRYDELVMAEIHRRMKVRFPTRDGNPP